MSQAPQSIPGLPPGFRLEDPPDLPSGFVLDSEDTRQAAFVRRMDSLAKRTEELRKDSEASSRFLVSYWDDLAKAYRSQRPELRNMPLEVATATLLKDTDFATREAVRRRKLSEWETTEAPNRAVGEYLRRRTEIANAVWQQHRELYPDASTQEAMGAMHRVLAAHGFQPPGAGRLPPLVFKDGKWENQYVPVWTELKSLAGGLATGTYRIQTGPKRIGTMIGEAVHDAIHGSDLGAEVSTSNPYRAKRQAELLRSEQVQDIFAGFNKKENIPYLPEGFNIYSIIGEQVPQFAVTAGAGSAVRQGLVSRFLGSTAVAANMFAVETPQAYDQYMEFASKQGMDPRDASQVAAGGAITYGVVSGVLERVGPFELLSKNSPDTFGRLAKAAITSLTEGGTEFSQAMTQAAIAQGLDLHDIDWEAIKGAIMEGLAGAVVGGLAGAATFEPGETNTPPQLAGPGHTLDPALNGRATDLLDQADVLTRGTRPEDVRRRLQEQAQSLPADMSPSEFIRAKERISEAELGLILEDLPANATPSQIRAQLEYAQRRMDEAQGRSGLNEQTERGSEPAKAGKRAQTAAERPVFSDVDTKRMFRSSERTGRPVAVVRLAVADLEPFAEHSPAGREVAGRVRGIFQKAVESNVRRSTARRFKWNLDQSSVEGDQALVLLAGRTEGDSADVVARIKSDFQAGLRDAGLEPVEGPSGSILPGLVWGASTKLAGTEESFDRLLQSAESSMDEATAEAVPTLSREGLERPPTFQAATMRSGDPTPVTVEDAAPADTVPAEQVPTEKAVSPTKLATSLQTTTTLSKRAAQEASKRASRVAKDAPGSATTAPFATYEEGSKTLDRPNRNVWVRQTRDKSNSKRVLLVQWSFDLLQTESRGSAQDQYSDALYAKRRGYVRADDFWELPQWIGQAAYNLPNTDLYVVRDVDEAVRFMNEAGYGQVAFSVLDVNKSLVRRVAEGYAGPISVGGYVDFNTEFAGLPNVVAYDTLAEFVKDQSGRKFAKGTDYRHFAGTAVQPRLTLSEGCLHKCAFCVVPKNLCILPPADVKRQLKSFSDLDYTLVYVNDKTFGQASNYTDLAKAYDVLKAQNPNFSGFIIQTTAAQMKKLDADFLKQAGVRFVELGVESYNDDILKKQHKPATTAIIDSATEKLRESGISLIPNVIIGLPQETPESYGRTLTYLRRNADVISHVNVYNLAVYSGTELADVTQAKLETDIDENRVEKSFHEKPEVHRAFAQDIYAVGQELLDKPALGNLPPSNEIVVDAEKQGILWGGVKSLLSDESGALDVDGFGRVITGGLQGAAEEGAVLSGGVQALILDESGPLQRTKTGEFAVSLIDEAEARHRLMRGRLLQQFDDALADMNTATRHKVLAWMNSLQDDGDTNWKTLLEHPERLDRASVPPEIQPVAAAYLNMQEVTGKAAEDAGLPQLARKRNEDGSTSFAARRFKRAQSGKYFRSYTRDGQEALRYQRGPVWDALIAWLIEHPDRNPGLSTDAIELRRQLSGLRRSGATKKAGSLEYVRVFDDLPVSLRVGDRWVNLLTRDPRAHFMLALESQSRRIALWDTAQRMLLPRYGTFDEDSGEIVYRTPRTPPGVNDVDGLIDNLRSDVARGSTRPGRDERLFNRMLSNYQRVNLGGVMENYLVDLGDSRLAELATAIDRSVTAGVLSLAPIWDIFNPIRTAPAVGFRGFLRGYGNSLVTILTNPRKFSAEYEALGAVIDSHRDWTIHRDTWFHDVFVKDIPQALMTLGAFSERRSQFIVARTYDLWVQKLNQNRRMTPADARFLKRHLRLTDSQVYEIASGSMTEATRAKVLQNSVNTISGLPEARHRKGAVQNHPVGKFLFRFLSVTNSVARGAVRHTGDVAEDVRSMTHARTREARVAAAERLANSGWRLLAFVASVAGSGFLQRYARRAASGRPLIDPDDPESWTGLLAESMAEGGIFGPFYRMFEAARYSRGDLYRVPANLIFPLAVTTEVGMALLGLNQYDGTPFSRRLESLGVRYTPVWKAARGWWARATYPTREDYYQTRKLSRVFNEKLGRKPEPGMGPKNFHYLVIFEAVRDSDKPALLERLDAYKSWAKSEGLSAEEARLRLRASLESRSPISVPRKNQAEFLGGLSPANRIMAKTAEENYQKITDSITHPIGRPVRPRRANMPKPVSRLTGDWYNAR